MARRAKGACLGHVAKGSAIASSPSMARRAFHDYFVTHLPSSSLHPDARTSAGPRHMLPRSASKPHTPRTGNVPTPAPVGSVARDTTVVRIPLKSAKHHFGVSVSRGQRPYNEDTYQAGVIDVPAFAKRTPRSISRAPASSVLQAYRERQEQAARETQARNASSEDGATSANAANGDPQVFYFGVYDGHGGAECSDFLKDRLHSYVEDAARELELPSSLQGPLQPEAGTAAEPVNSREQSPHRHAIDLEKAMIRNWRSLVGGYFRRFRPLIFQGEQATTVDISTILTYAFLKADYEFVSAQARKSDDNADPVMADAPLNASDVLDNPSMQIGGPKRFKGGSTCSVAMISTPSPMPFWSQATSCTLLVAHVGDSRILLCRTSDGLAEPMTVDHHPSNPAEAKRLRRYAGTFVTDSFGEERMSGLANTRAFGDMQSKRMGVSAEPEIRRVEITPAQFSFMALISDGVSGTLSDQEIVDIIKEARTPEQGAKDVVSFATEVSVEGDNATCICVRLGGWERRSEGGLGSLGTKEQRDFRRQEAADPRRRQ